MEETGHSPCFTEAKPQAIVDHQPIKRCGSDAALSAAGGCFDCNICLDFAVEPVVTLCGHLYCWPCIYKWLESASPQQCPVCKATLSQRSLIPLYGRGHATKPAHQGIPRRPPSTQHDIEPEPQRDPHPQVEHVSQPASPLRMPMLHYTSGGVLGGMAIAVLPLVLRNHGLYNTSPYVAIGGGTAATPPRVRRQEMQVERSLHQIWIFFLCCTILCLLLF